VRTGAVAAGAPAATLPYDGDAGAEVVFPFELQFYGDEGGRVRDPFGHSWGIARHVEDVSPQEMQRRMAAFYEDLSD
jgi:PhnB protein